MTVAQKKGDAGHADALFSRIIRSRGYCQYPDCYNAGPYDTAHLIGRSRRATRCVEDNAACLCRTHHQLIDSWFDEKERVVDATIGRARYDELKLLANTPSKLNATQFWAGELTRLKARCVELGLDTRRRLPS